MTGPEFMAGFLSFAFGAIVGWALCNLTWHFRRFENLEPWSTKKELAVLELADAVDLARYRIAGCGADLVAWDPVGHFQYDDYNGWRQVQSQYANDHDLTPLYRKRNSDEGGQ